MTFRVQVLSSWQDLQRIDSAWDELTAVAVHPMNASVWYGNACRFAHPAADRLHVIALWAEDRLAGIAPLILVNSTGAERYEIIGTRTLYEPAAILARNGEAFDRLAEVMAALRHPVVLTRLSATSEFNERFKRCARGAGLLFSSSASGSPFIQLHGGWNAYLQSRPSRLKNIIRRGYRQLGKLGHLEFAFVRPQPGEVSALLQEAFEVELRSWKGRAGSAVLLRPDLRAFFFQYGADLARRGELLVSCLRLDGLLVAMQVANVSSSAYWQLKIGYDEAYAKQLVGLQLQLETIKWSYQQGLAQYEFLGTAEPWLREWTGTVHPYRTVHFYPFNISGLRALVGDNISRVRGRLARL